MDLFDINLAASSDTTSLGSSNSLNNMPVPTGIPEILNEPRVGAVGQSSQPFNLDAITKPSDSNKLSVEAQKFLDELDNFQFMSSTVLMFPTILMSDENN